MPRLQIPGVTALSLHAEPACLLHCTEEIGYLTLSGTGVERIIVPVLFLSLPSGTWKGLA